MTESEIVVETLRSRADAKAHVRAWQHLADFAVEKNVFYEPWNLLPSLETVAQGRKTQLLCMYRRAGNQREMIGFFPFEHRYCYGMLLIRHLRLIGHRYCFLRSPLLHAAYEQEALDCFANWAAGSGYALIEMSGISTDMRSRLQRALERKSVSSSTVRRDTRAIFRPHRKADSYLADALSGKRRKEMRRMLRRLTECGALAYRRLDRNEDAMPWIDAFLELESRGWKGRANTAISCSDADRGYFVECALAAHSLGKLDFLGYFIGGRAIALSCKYLSGHDAFAFKIAFDEDYARYSPGVLLELRYIELAHEEAKIEQMDSCAANDHPMANRLWTGRRRIDTLLLAQSGYARAIAAITKSLRALKRRRRDINRSHRQYLLV